MAGVHVNKYAGASQYGSGGSKYARKRGQRVVIKPTTQDRRAVELMHSKGITLPEAQAELASLRKERALQTAQERRNGWQKELNGLPNGSKNGKA